MILKIGLIFSISLLLLAEFFHKISSITQDLGRHLLNGQIILQTHSLPKTNFFSFTYPDFPFINSHWLSEVVFYLVFKLSGFDGLLIFTTLIALAAFSFIFFYALKRFGLIPTAITSILYLNILSERTDLRPEILSFLFLSLFMIILYKYQEKFTKWIFVLPLIEFFWANTHIYFFIGISIVGLFLIDNLIANRKKLKNKDTFVLALVFFGSIAASFINPNGIEGALYPLKVFENYGYSIEENQNIFFLESLGFNKPAVLFLKVSFVFLFTSLIFSFKKTRPLDWMLFFFFSILSVAVVRNLPVFVFGTFIVFNQNFSMFYKNLITFLHKRNKNIDLLSEKSIASSLLIICLIVIIILFMKVSFSRHSFGFGVETGAKNGADFFISQNLKGPIFNNFDIGSYLDFRLYPKEKVFIDGRPEAYPASFFKDVYIPMQENEAIFEKVSEKYKLNSIFFAYTDQTPWANLFIKQIINNKKWKLVYLDDYAVILIKNTSSDNKVLDKFSVDPNLIDINSLNLKGKESFLRLALLFSKTGLKDQEIKTHQKILEIDPSFCPSLYSLSFLLSKEQSPLFPVFAGRYKQICR
ncbi:MAG: hypothetical protein Q7R53_00450 [bacterium]|nr:hypothetical protein [bacterium]